MYHLSCEIDAACTYVFLKGYMQLFTMIIFYVI